MKILWISPLPSNLAAGCVESRLLRFFKHPAPWITSHLPPVKNIDLHIASAYPGGSKNVEFELSGAKWHLVPVPASGRALRFFAQDFKYFECLFKKISPDVVHSWGTEDSNSIVAQKLLPKKTLIGIQGLSHQYLSVSGINGILRRLICSITEVRTLSKSRFIVAESNYSLKCASKLANKASGHIVQHPVRPEILSADFSSDRLNRALFAGNLTPRKGILEALTAFAVAAPKNWSLHVAGEGEYKFVSKMKHLAEKLGLGDRIKFLGSLDTGALIKEMQLASIFLLPTKMDTGPTALKEAICMGLWPVCFNNSGPSEYIQKFNWGSLAQNLNQEDLNRKLKTAIEDKHWTQIAHNNNPVLKARSFFSADSAWNSLIPIYRMIINSK